MTIDDAANPTREIVLPSGRRATVKQLLTRDRKEFLEIFSRMLLPVAFLQDEGKTALTDDDVRVTMVQVLLDALAAGPEEASVVHRFFEFFSNLTPGAEWPVEDVEALWLEVYERNRIPFAYERSKRAQLLKAILATSLEERPAIAEILTSAGSSASLSPPESTLAELENSPGLSPSPSPKNSAGVKPGETTPEPSSTPTP